MPIVYLDTSIIMNEAFLRSAYAQSVLKACSLLNVQIAVPEIVADETIGNFPKKLNEKAKAYKVARRSLAKLVDLEDCAFSSEEAIESFESWLNDLVAEFDIAILPYPDLSTKEIVVASYAGEKPFNVQGIGHKDFLVWKSIVEHLHGAHDSSSSFFLTNNTKDFCEDDENGQPTLHQDLCKDIDIKTPAPAIYTSMKQFFDSELLPQLEGIQIAEVPDLSAQDIQELAADLLLKELPQRTAFGIEGVPFGNDVSIASIGEHKIDDVSLKKVDGDIVIAVLGYVDVEVEGFIDKHAYYLDADDGPKVHVWDSNWNDHVMAVSTSIETSFELNIFYSAADQAVTGFQITLPDEIEDEWPYK